MAFAWIARLRGLLRSERLDVSITPRGPKGRIVVPSAGDGRWTVQQLGERAFLSPDQSSYYLYFVLPKAFLRRARNGVWIAVEYLGEMFGLFCLHYVSIDRSAPHDGLYKVAQQLWSGRPGERRLRRALFRLHDFDPSRRQNLNASFRLEFRRELLLGSLSVALDPPDGEKDLTVLAPNPELRKLPGRRYPITYLFIELTNVCNFKCVFCPEATMRRKRGFMARAQALRLIDEVAAKRSWLGPIFPVKLHQMGEPMLHPDLADIVAHAEASGVPIELNTNCGLITAPIIDALYAAGLTHMILSYQTPDEASFRKRNAPRLTFAEYLARVRLAVERKIVLGATTRIEIDVMNSKDAGLETIVSEEGRAIAVLKEWIGFCRELESRYGLQPRVHDIESLKTFGFLDRCEDDGSYELMTDVRLLWKRLHGWSNTIGPGRAGVTPETYCPLPYDQLVVQWNGDAVLCCTDHEGGTRFDNALESSIESVWLGASRRRRLQDMLEGRLTETCARCQGRLK
ncbi:MAG: radical SAM/SPASM domain-containing protein [Vicinamibacteria bacterium]|nr:radical SAM/SPASM domain-containing protein [Vicinamibacteria bacterium]